MAEQSEVDIILTKIGLGRWQLIQFIWLILLYLLWADIFISIVIIGYVPDFACSPSHNVSSVLNSTDPPVFDNQCFSIDPITNVSEPCRGGYIYAEPKHSSVVSDWDLVCGQSYLAELSQSVLNVGLFVGAIVFPPIADKYGRRHVFIWNHAAFLLISAGTAFVPNMWWFIVFRGLCGAFGSGAAMISWIVTLELFTPKHRTYAAVAGSTFWGVCVCTLPLIGYIMDGRRWRHLQLVFSVYAIVWIGEFMTVEEPIRWLLANGKRKEALRIVKKAAKSNRLDNVKLNELIADHFPNLISDQKTEVCKMTQVDDTTLYEMVPLTDQLDKTAVGQSSDLDKVAQASWLDIIRHPALRKATAIMFTNSLTYSGLYMLSSEMSGSRYLNLFLNAVVEIPSGLVLFPLTMRFGRRPLCVMLHVMAGISLIAAGVINLTLDGSAADIGQKITVICGKFSITSSFMVIFLYTPELYPTNIRTIGTAAADLTCRVGGFIAPFTSTVARAVPWAPALVFGILCILVAISSLFLPETANRELSQTLEDIGRDRAHDKTNKDKLFING